MPKLVRKSLSSRSKPTAAQLRRLAKLKALPADSIDLSDIPELDEKFFRCAMRNPFMRSLNVRVDAEVMRWLQRCGKNRDRLVNAALRNFIKQ
jgi:uncharacterized protein (DUF4415 family)